MTAGQVPGPKSVSVVGAGVVGLSCALHLQRDGHRVTLFDPREPGTATSYGNAGAIVTSSCAPVAHPGLWKQIPGMLRDPLGPMVLRWRYLPWLMPWLIELLRASRPARVEEVSKALVAINSLTGEAWRDLARQAGVEDLIHPVGWLKVYETDAGFAASQSERDILARRGRKFEILNSDELRQLEPALAPLFRHGLFQPEADFNANPGRATAAFAADFAARGGTILREEVTDIVPRGGHHGVVTTQGAHGSDVVVLAAGAWSRGLAKRLGARVPLDTERGYHLMLPPAEPGLRRPVVHGEQSFVLCPMESGLRLTSQVELAGLKAPADFRRIRGLLPRAQRMLPSLRAEECSAWLGFRPSMPDSLPVIGPSPRVPNVFFAFGHGHLGLTEGPITGRIVADLVAGRDPGLDPAPYSAQRWI